MANAKKGDKVRINFTGKLDDSTIFDSTLELDECDTECCEDDDCGCEADDCGCGHETGPAEIVIGEEELFPQIDEALIGMKPGDKKTITIPVEDAFGEYDEERVFTVPRADLPKEFDAQVGDELVLSDEDDEALPVVVVEVTEEGVTFDANHPLAGSDLTYEIELLEII